MKELKAILYTMLMLSCISAVLLIRYPTITGNATLEIDNDRREYGSYTIHPHFTVDSTSDLSSYKNTRIAARELLEDVRVCTGALDSCIQDSIRNAGLAWSCPKDTEAFFLEFAEFYSSCAASADNDCLCRMDYSARSYDNGIYMIALTGIQSMSVIESPGVQSVAIDEFSPALLSEGGGFLNFRHGDIRINAIYTGGRLGKASYYYNDIEFQLGSELVLYKRYPDISIVPESISIGSPDCALRQKTTYVFCDSGIRFALEFPEPQHADDDEPAPAPGTDQ
jgi:hypothetical protein